MKIVSYLSADLIKEGSEEDIAKYTSEFLHLLIHSGMPQPKFEVSL